MIISLVRLPVEGRHFEHEYDRDSLDLSEQEFKLAVPPGVSGRVERTGADIRVRGQLKAEITVPCARCLEAVTIAVDEPFDLYYTPAEDAFSSAGEKELQLKDLDFGFLEKEEIDLDELAREQLALSVPVRVLCKETCRGLCPHCGIDLNHESCDCRRPIDPRWQPLADIQIDAGKKRDQ